MAAAVLPRNTLVDGEIVIADENGQADFGALQQGLSLARKFIAQAVADRPAILLVFDVLELAGEELAVLPLTHGDGRSSDCSILVILASSS